MTDRPEEVPDDWVLVDCANDECSFTVWVPDFIPVTPGVLNVCSVECAEHLSFLFNRQAPTFEPPV